jgi:hypothetical protein
MAGVPGSGRFSRRTYLPPSGTRRFQRSRQALITGFLTTLRDGGPQRDDEDGERRVEAARRVLARHRQ